MKPAIQANPKLQARYKKLRTNFKLKNSQLKSQPFENLISHLKNSSIIQLKILDTFFFPELYNRLKQLERKTDTLKKLEEFVKMVEGKIAFFPDVIIIYRSSLDQYLKIRQKAAVSETQIVAKEEINLRNFMIPNIQKFLQIYYELSAKQKLKLSRTFIDEVRINFDHDLTQLFKQEIDKLMPVNNQSFKKIQSDKSSHLIDYDLYFEEKDFIEKMMFKIREMDDKYNTEKKPNPNNIECQASHLQKMISNLQIEQFVSTKCINCAQFFYKDVPFIDQQNSLVDYELVPCVRSIKKSQERDQILQNMTALLNNGNGTLLFNCKPTKFGFIPIGFQMTLKEQEAIKYSFQNLFKYIKIEAYQKSIEWDIGFIPLKVSPSVKNGQLIKDPRQPYVRRDYVRNTYVMRVKLKAKSQRQFFGCQIDFKTYYYVRINRKTQQVKDRQVYQQIKMKTLDYIRFKDMQGVQKVENKLKDGVFDQVIRGTREYRKNLHQGPCKQPLILSVNSNNQ